MNPACKCDLWGFIPPNMDNNVYGDARQSCLLSRGKRYSSICVNSNQRGLRVSNMGIGRLLLIVLTRRKRLVSRHALILVSVQIKVEGDGNLIFPIRSKILDLLKMSDKVLSYLGSMLNVMDFRGARFCVIGTNLVFNQLFTN